VSFPEVRLARAVRPEEAGDPARPDFEAQVVNGDDSPVATPCSPRPAPARAERWRARWAWSRPRMTIGCLRSSPSSGSPHAPSWSVTACRTVVPA